MSKTVELSVAQTTLSELISGLQPNEELLIVENQKPLAFGAFEGDKVAAATGKLSRNDLARSGR